MRHQLNVPASGCLPPAGTRWRVRQPPRMRVCSPLIPSCGISSTEGCASTSHASVFTEAGRGDGNQRGPRGRMYSADLGAARAHRHRGSGAGGGGTTHKDIALLTGRDDEQGEA